MSKGKKIMVSVLAALMLAGAAVGTAEAYNTVWQCVYCGRQVTKGGPNPPSGATCDANPNVNSWGQHGNHVYQRIR